MSSEGEPLIPANQRFEIRLNELRARSRILGTLRTQRMQESLQRMFEDPSTESYMNAFGQVFKDGEEFGKLSSDGLWVASLGRLGLPLELIMQAWEIKDEEQRRKNETDTNP